MRRCFCPLAAVFLVALALPASAQERNAYYDRHDIPGQYTLGLYATPDGEAGELELDADQEEFELWFGITGDSTRSFSGVVFGLDLPPGVRMAGPIRWETVPGLKESGVLGETGVQVEFNQECQLQVGEEPLMIARLPLAADPLLEEFELAPRKHRSFGLSVELCQPELGWPKPFAEPVPVKISRKRSLWDRVKGMVD